jgi:hypothetical protein
METVCRYACAYIPPAPSPSSAYAVVWRSRLGLRSRPRPRPRLAPSSPPLHSPSPPLCSTERACFKLHPSAHVPAHSPRWRSAGARAGTSTPRYPPPHRPSCALVFLLMRMHMHAVESERRVRARAFTRVRMKRTTPSSSHSCSSSCNRGRVFVRTAPASPSFSCADTEGACSTDLDIILDVDAHSRVGGVGDGDGEFTRVCVYLLPVLSLAVSRSYPTIFLLKLGRILLSARFDVCPASHPPSTYARPSRSTREVAKFGYHVFLSFKYYSFRGHSLK